MTTIGLPDGIRACLFGFDGVLTKTAVVHAAKSGAARRRRPARHAVALALAAHQLPVHPPDVRGV
ncbi:hypothetical protein AB0B44_35250, partial [Streptomyces sp. NPDC041003]